MRRTQVRDSNPCDFTSPRIARIGAQPGEFVNDYYGVPVWLMQD